MKNNVRVSRSRCGNEAKRARSGRVIFQSLTSVSWHRIDRGLRQIDYFVKKGTLAGVSMSRRESVGFEEHVQYRQTKTLVHYKTCKSYANDVRMYSTSHKRARVSSSL